MNKLTKVFNFEVKQEGPEEDRVLRFVGSDETPDRDNDIIEVAGWKLDDYMKNPVFLWAHHYGEPPIGKAVSVMADIASKKLLFDIKFATVEEYPFADTIYKLYKGGYLSATSVGFHGMKYKTRDEEEVLSMPEWQRGRRYMEQELLELSAVPVPCNPNALQQARSKGLIPDAEEKFFKPEEKDLEVYMTEETKATALIAKTREFLKDFKLMPTQIIVDGKEADVFVKVGPENSITLSFDFLEGNKNGYVRVIPYDLLMPKTEEKSGSTLSAKNRELLNSVHDGIDKCRQDLKGFLDSTMPMEPPEDPMMTAARTAPASESVIKVELSDEFKQALDEIKSQVLLLSGKMSGEPGNEEAPKVEFNLDAIELPEAEKDPADIELDIEPGELKTMIQETVKTLIRGGN